MVEKLYGQMIGWNGNLTRDLTLQKYAQSLACVMHESDWSSKPGFVIHYDELQRLFPNEQIDPLIACEGGCREGDSWSPSKPAFVLSVTLLDLLYFDR